MEERAKKIFRVAETYSKAARNINAAAEMDPSQLLPSQVIAALALELYFKSLYFIENNKEFKINNRHSHDFSTLFGELSKDLRDSLEANFQSLMKKRNMQDVHIIESECVKVHRDLKSNLRCWKDVFTQVRYMYDNPNKEIQMMFFPEIEQAVKETIFSFRPNFQS